MPAGPRPSATKPETLEARAARIRTALRRQFGLTRLRPGQQQVMDRILDGQHTLAVMPTGAGKSLCYQLPAVLLPGRTVVISPLIALMKDQCEALQARGIAAVQLNSGVGNEEQAASEAAVADGSARIIMTTPERLADPAFLELVSAHPVSLVAVDEAHCISHWGHDFRPAFLEIGRALKPLGHPTVLALTATATDDVAKDICEQLHIPPEGLVNTSVYRPNLDLRVEQVAAEDEKLDRTLRLVRTTAGPGIVYAATIKAAAAVHAALLQAGENAGLYHGKLSANERNAAQEAFMDGRCRVMVATNAFGLGIDKADIRFVLHYQMPATLESYYQEAGRAGRDGAHARCILLFLRSDKAVQQFFMAGRYPTEDDAAVLVQTLQEPPPDGDAWTLPLLQGRLARPRSKLQVALGVLRRQKIVSQAMDGSLKLLRAGLRSTNLDKLMDAYREKRDQDREALERMVAYAQGGQCRWRVVLEHLEGRLPFERCGHCDNCRRIAAHESVIEQLAARQAETAEEQVEEEGEIAAVLLARGDVVSVRRYGRGVVSEANSQQVTVVFADGSRRSFLPQFVQKERTKAKPAVKAAAKPGAKPDAKPVAGPGGPALPVPA